jgi:outer membrane protein
MKLKTRCLLPLLVAAFAAQIGVAQAPAASVPVETVPEKSPWSVMLRATYLVTTDGSSPKVPVKIEDKLIPEFDVEYRLNDKWAVELVLTVPQEHAVKFGGGPLGDFKHLPPTLLVKYYAGEFGGFRPYVGAGVNFTLIFDDNLAGGLKLDNYSVGPAVQAGADYALSDRWALNLDVKRMMLRTDVSTAGGAKVSELKLDPWLLALGLKYNF